MLIFSKAFLKGDMKMRQGTVEIKKAKGRVLRQGGVFIVEKTRDCNSFLPRNHDYEAKIKDN
jgi:hypothetical protein